MKITETTSQKIKNISIICALLVVTIHVGWPKEDICLTWFIHELITDGIASIAVPFFFVVSGFFIAVHFDDEKWWRNETRKRIGTLLVPFFVWAVISSVVMVPLSIVADIIAHRPFGTNIFIGNGSWIHTLGLEFDCCPALTPLWYVRCLFIFVIASPLFKMVVDRFKIAWLVLSFTVAIIFSGIPFDGNDAPFWQGFFYYGWSLSGMFYFSVGIYLQRFSISFSSRRIAVICALYGLSILIIRTYFHMQGKTFPFGIGCFLIPSLLYATWYLTPSVKFSHWFTSCSFSVFLLHCIFLGYAGILFKHIPIGTQLAKIITCIFAMVGPIILTNFMRKFFPKTTSFLFAGRS